TTIVTTLMVAMVYGATFGALQQVPQMVPGLSEVREMTAGLPPAQAGQINQQVAANVLKVQEMGGLAGRLMLAYLSALIVSRRRILRLFQIPGLVVVPLAFALATSSLPWMYPAMFIAGMLTIGQLSFWGNYLPRVYPTHLRGTGESFAANMGGRLVGTSFAWVTATLAITPDRGYAPTKVAMVAASVGFAVYLVGFIASFWLPEPKRAELPD
ncbi:MAG TPA: hypothetical protein VFI87_04020, partial [Hyphomicrobiaceae bacterium]|nr:hypothetical protein [Hyphomicrobiaceae bacterium]